MLQYLRTHALWVALAGVLVMAGAYLPWAYGRPMLAVPGEPREVVGRSGSSFDGEVTFVLGALVLLVVLAASKRDGQLPSSPCSRSSSGCSG